MERASAVADVHRLFEQMYDLIDKPDLNRCREGFRELTDEISTLCMVQAQPGRDLLWNGVYFSPKRRRLVEALFAKLGRVVTKETLYELLCDANGKGPQLKTLDVHVCRIRDVLKATPYRVQTSFGYGYAMVHAGETLASERGTYIHGCS